MRLESLFRPIESERRLSPLVLTHFSREPVSPRLKTLSFNERNLFATPALGGEHLLAFAYGLTPLLPSGPRIGLMPVRDRKTFREILEGVYSSVDAPRDASGF